MLGKEYRGGDLQFKVNILKYNKKYFNIAQNNFLLPIRRRHLASTQFNSHQHQLKCRRI